MNTMNELNSIYQQNLETNIIEYLAKTLNIDFRDAMDTYYTSKLDT